MGERSVQRTRRSVLALPPTLTISGLTVGCLGEDETPETTGEDDRTGDEDDAWRSIWTEEFSELDQSVWTFETGNGHQAGIPGWGNDELQYYTAGDNVDLDSEGLVIEVREEARSDEFGSYDYTSSRLVSQGARTVEYGRIDVRARLPGGQGVWPAVWLLGADIDDVGWPTCGEIDIVELVGHEPERIHGTVHGPGYSGGAGIGSSYTLEDDTFADGFHVFSIVWEEDELTWSVDGQQYHQVTRSGVEADRDGDWVFDGPFFFIMNLAVGGDWPGDPDESTGFPKELEIDFIRLSERQ